MNFLKLFLRAIALIPGVVQGTEALFGAKTGAQKKKAAVEIVGAAINIADAVTMKHIADCGQVYGGAEHADRRRGEVPECEPLGEAVECGCGAVSVGETV